MIDVTVATMNSGKTIALCLDAILRTIPVRNIIVVDGGSHDDTIEICESYGCKTYVSPLLSLGQARFFQAKMCETDFIVYVDSDVYIKETWWRAVSRELKKHGNRIGIVNSKGKGKSSNSAYYKFSNWLYEKKRINVSFSNTLTRRELVLKCEKLNSVHAGEDKTFFDFVRERGYKIITIKEPLAYHDKDGYLHHPYAYYRMGKSETFVKVLRWTPSTMNLLWKWLRFSLEEAHFDLQLMCFVLKLQVNRLRGNLS